MTDRSLRTLLRRAAACAAAVAVVALPLSSCTRTGAPGAAAAGNPWTRHGRLRIGSPQEPDNLNPMFAHSDATDQVDSLIFAPLLRYDRYGNLFPELATEVPSYANGGISKDSKTITIHVRRGATWSDGAPLDARDFRFTWRAVRDPSNAVKSTFGWDDITSVDLPDDRTAVLHLARPNADVLGLLGIGGSAYPPLPEHLLKNVKNLAQSSFASHPISSGPFVLRAWNHGSSLEFVANPRYWRGKPKLDAITYAIVPDPTTLINELRTHDVDVVANVAENQVAQLATIAGISVVKHLISNYRRLEINTSRPALRDRTVRLAIAEAVDWDDINRTIYHGYNRRAQSDIPPDSWAAPAVPFYPHDPKAATAMLDADGWRMGPDGVRAKDGTRLELTILATTSPGNEQSEVLMQQQLRPLGIALAIKNFPASYLFAQNGPLYTGNYDLEWSIDTDGPDPDNQGAWSSAFVPPHGANTSFIRDPLIDRTSDMALRTFDRARRKALYQQEESRIHELVPAVFFYWENTHAAYNSDLKNYEPAEYITDNWNCWEWEI